MTAREIFESMLTELSHTNAPSLLLQDYNYYVNKAINQYVNKLYNIYDVNQQTTDSVRVLKATSILDAVKSSNLGTYKSLANLGAGKSKILGATYEVDLPSDYLHILNCMCLYKVNKVYKCYNADDYVQFPAKRLTADSWSIISNDYYNRPLPERPYYYIHNVNTSNVVPTNPISNSHGTDMEGLYSATINGGGKSNFPRTLQLKDKSTVSTVQKESAYRYGNASKVRMEIRYGHDDSIFTLEKVLIDYIKVPLYIRLTQEQVNLTEDTSQIMEFPDYVCQEIINELTKLVMANNGDPRINIQPIVSLSIASPAQQLSATPQA